MYTEGASGASGSVDFIRQHIERYGLLGENNVESSLGQRVPSVADDPEFTKGNHFKFGFDGGVFNGRPTRSSIYWVEYSAITRSHRSFREELRQALIDVADRVGAFSVTSSRSYIAALVAAEATQLGLPVRRIAIEIEGLRPAHLAADGETERHTVSWDQFSAFAKEFAKCAGCSDPWIAFEAMHGHLSDLPHIYDGSEIRIENNNFDWSRRCAVGEAEWSLVDNEKFTAINRFLLEKGRLGIPQILRWSPELLAAQINSSPYRRWFQYGANKGGMYREGGRNRLARIGLAVEAMGSTDVVPSAKLESCEPALDELMKALRRNMKNIAPGCVAQHRYPLWRLSPLLGLDGPDRFNVTPAWYGVVHEQ